ncbi:MAG: SH3 domain-containing protein [Chloroflexota bacterium]
MRRMTFAYVVLVFAFALIAVQPGNIAAQTAPTDQPTVEPPQPIPDTPTVTPTPVTCQQVLDLVKNTLSTDCTKLDKDQICFANNAITAEYIDPNSVAQFPFGKLGDIVPMNTLKSYTTSPLSLAQNEWGMAVLKMQAVTSTNTGTDQTATFILYGDTTIKDVKFSTAPINTPSPNQPTPAPVKTCSASPLRPTRLRTAPRTDAEILSELTTDATIDLSERSLDGAWVYGTTGGKAGWIFASNLQVDCSLLVLPRVDPNAPHVDPSAALQLPAMQEFTFTTATTPQADCQQLPPSGLFIEAPTGKTVTFKANGVTLTIGSRVILTAVPNGKMTISVIEGGVNAKVGDKQVQISGGEQSTIQLGGDTGLQPVGEPSPVENIPDLDNIIKTYLPAICDMAKSAGLNPNCVVVVPGPKPDLTCNNNGLCDKGENNATCPKDCAAGGQPAS